MSYYEDLDAIRDALRRECDDAIEELLAEIREHGTLTGLGFSIYVSPAVGGSERIKRARPAEGAEMDR